VASGNWKAPQVLEANLRSGNWLLRSAQNHEIASITTKVASNLVRLQQISSLYFALIFSSKINLLFST
jgi:hypothetical protein